MLNSNYLIINRKPQKFEKLRIAGRAAVFIDDAGKVLDNGVLALDDSVYAALYCDEVRNITIVTDRGGRRDVFTILWFSEEGYRNDSESLRKAYSGRFSRQNLKLNRYAESIAEKLDNGVRLRVTDAVDESGMKVCPECGMMNPVESGYCLECGAEI
jgi:hypothetical protein